MSENVQQAYDEKGALNSTFLESALWEKLQHSNSIHDFAEAWLALQSSQLADLVRSMVILKSSTDLESDISIFWPDTTQQHDQKFINLGEIAIAEKRIIVKNVTKLADVEVKHCQISVPLFYKGDVLGAVIVELAVNEEEHVSWVIRQLQWGANGLDTFFSHLNKTKTFADEQVNIILHLLARCVDSVKFQSAATQVVTELASLLNCDRVSLGFCKGSRIKVAAISNTAQFNKKTNVAAKISAVMEEAIDQKSTLLFPAPKDDTTYNTIYAHSNVDEENKSAICTVPLAIEGEVFGALSFQRSIECEFEQETVELCEVIASLIGPVLELKRKDEQWWFVKLFGSAKAVLIRLFGQGYLLQKLSFILLVGIVVFFAVAESQYRVSANANLEGKIHRAVVAPFDGFIIDSVSRAGDVVVAGQMLAKLDDKDILVERINWQGKKNQYAEQYRDALAKFIPSEIKVLKTKLGQAKAEISLLDEMLKRTTLVAPFDGIVVSGDLSQLMGSPVTKGEVLFEIAPLNSYRVILEVDERDIRDIRVSQNGHLVLTGKSDLQLPFAVEKITPVAEQREGRNYFRVEALLEQNFPFLRPGMKGVGKIELGQRKLIWIWTHNMIDWVRLWWWNWWP